MPKVAPGFVDTACCAGAGGVWTDSCRAAPPLAVRSGFSGVSVWTCYFGAPTEVVVKPSRSRGNPLFTEGARLSVPLAPAGTLGVPGCLLGGGHAKGPQDATAGILALLSRVWYPARRAIALSVVVLKESCPKAAYGTRAWGVK